MRFEDRWNQLESEMPISQGIGKQKITVLQTDSCSLDLAMERSQANLAPTRAFYITFLGPTGSKAVPDGTRYVDIFATKDDATQIGVVLRDPDLDSIFSALAEDIVRSLEGTETPEIAQVRLLDRLAKWRRLLSVGPSGLSPLRQRGLFGELLTLTELLVPIWGVERAIGAWHGPSGSSRDFEIQEKAVESKVSTTNEPQQMIINGERQLDDAGLEELVLVHYSLEVIEGGTASLVAAVDLIRELVDGHAVSANFEDGLLEAGYSDDHSHMYRTPGYHVHKRHLWRVADGFPRLIQSDLPDGIGSIRYSIAVDACSDHLVERDQLERLLTLDS